MPSPTFIHLLSHLMRDTDTVERFLALSEREQLGFINGFGLQADAREAVLRENPDLAVAALEREIREFFGPYIDHPNAVRWPGDPVVIRGATPGISEAGNEVTIEINGLFFGNDASDVQVVVGQVAATVLEVTEDAAGESICKVSVSIQDRGVYDLTMQTSHGQSTLPRALSVF